MSATTVHRGWCQGWQGWGVRLLAACLLLSAVAAKLFWPLPWDAREDPLLAVPWVRVVVIQAEFWLGVWLASGVRPRSSSQTAAAFFLLLASVALWKTLRGESSCGCFGPLQIPPVPMLLVDLAAAGLLMLYGRQRMKHATA